MGLPGARHLGWKKVTEFRTSGSFDRITHREPGPLNDKCRQAGRGDRLPHAKLRAPWQRVGGRPGKWPELAGLLSKPTAALQAAPAQIRLTIPNSTASSAYRVALLSFPSKFQPENRKQLNCTGGHRDLNMDLFLKNKLIVCE